jgi:hypothetical protein
MEQLGIHKAICAIKLSLAGGGGIAKDRKAMGYSFRGIEDFDRILCGMTAEHGVSAFPRILKWELRDGQTKNGGYQAHAIVEVEWTFTCAVDGSQHIASTMGEAMDTQDKAFNKAMQASRKYADIMVFRIPVAGDDTEIYVPEPSTTQAPALAPPKPTGDPMAAQMSNGTLLPTQQEPPRRTRGPNKPKPEAAPQPGAGTHVVTPPFVAPQVPAFVPEPPPDANGNVYAPESPEDHTTALMGRIGEINTFPLLYAVAQDADNHVEPGRTELFSAIKNRAVYLFGEAKSLAEVQEGFSLVSAMGQPEMLKKAANDAYARYR